MKLITIILLNGCSLLCSLSAGAQGQDCACRKFPFYFCNGNGQLITLCTDNPTARYPHRLIHSIQMRSH